MHNILLYFIKQVPSYALVNADSALISSSSIFNGGSLTLFLSQDILKDEHNRRVILSLLLGEEVDRCYSDALDKFSHF